MILKTEYLITDLAEQDKHRMRIWDLSWFRVYWRPLEIKVSTVDSIVTATCVLYNYLWGNLSYKDDVSDIDPADFEEPSGQFTDLNSSDASRRPTRKAFKVREQFKEFFNSEMGSVAWQVQTMQKGKY